MGQEVQNILFCSMTINFYWQYRKFKVSVSLSVIFLKCISKYIWYMYMKEDYKYESDIRILCVHQLCLTLTFHSSR